MWPVSASSSYLFREPDGTSTKTRTSLIAYAEPPDSLDEQVEERVRVEIDADVGVRGPARAEPQVDDGSAATEVGGELHLDVAELRLDQPRTEDVRDRDRVVDGRSVPAVRLTVVDGEEVDELGDEDADRPGVAQALLHVGPRHGPVRHVEPDHRDVELGVEDDLRGLRVGPDVELGGRRHVPLGDRASHQDDPVDPRGAVRAGGTQRCS